MNHLFKEKWERLQQFPGLDLMPMYMYQKRYAHVSKAEEGLLARIRETLRRKEKVSKADLRLLERQGEREYKMCIRDRRGRPLFPRKERKAHPRADQRRNSGAHRLTFHDGAAAHLQQGDLDREGRAAHGRRAGCGLSGL